MWELARPWRAHFLGGAVLLLVLRASALMVPVAMKFVIDDVLSGRQTRIVSGVAALIVAVSLLQATASHLQSRVTGGAVRDVICTLRERLHRHVLRLPIAWHDRQNSAELGFRIVHDTDLLRQAINTGLVDFSVGVTTGLLGLAILFAIDVRMAGFVVLLACLFLASFALGIARLRPLAKERVRLASEMTNEAAQDCAGIRVLRSFRAESHRERSFGALLQSWREVMTRVQRGSAVLNSLVYLVTGACGTALLWAGAHEISAGRLTTGGLVGFFAVMAWLIYPAIQIVSIGSQFADSYAAIDRIRQLLDLPEDTCTDEPMEKAMCTEHLRFVDVDFGYVDREETLRGVSFVVRRGEFTAIVGCSGAGKSTLIGLITGFYRPTQGAVLFNGTESGNPRESVALVTQEPFLFSGTIRDNIVLGRSNIPAEVFDSVCRQAMVTDFVSELPVGFDTPVGERGIQLSGGQRQRICVARALLGDPELVLLDEPTSNVDLITERRLRRALAPLLRNKTVIAIAHRLSTVREADQILVMHNGRIVESGTHAQLVQERRKYFELFESDFNFEDLEPGRTHAVTATSFPA
ncbi:MAG: ABC transporter ATP-binding protein [Terriglobales bacterium]